MVFSGMTLTEMVLLSESQQVFTTMLIQYLLGRADFLCFKKTGVINGYLNRGPGNMINQGMIKHGEGRERQSKSISIAMMLRVNNLFRSSNGVS